MIFKDFTIKDIHNGLIKKEFSAREVAQSYLKQIKSEDEKIGAFLRLSKDLAFKQAEEVDKLISQGKEI